MIRMKSAPFVLGVGALVALLAPAVASSDEAFERARSLAAEKRYREAREVLDPMLKRAPYHPRARLLHGILRAREGRVREAIEIFERLRRDRPEMSEPPNNLAVLYAAQGRYDKARTTLLAALERKPSAIGYANLGDVYTNLAHRAYQRASELEPDARIHSRTGGESVEALSLVDPPAFVPAAADPSPAGSAAGSAGGPVAAVPAPPVGSMCLRAGGFEDRRALIVAEGWLAGHSADAIEVHREPQSAARSWQVYLPPLASRAEAAAKVREVRGHNVRDVAVIGAGPLKNGVSLGVFRVKENVRRRVSALTDLGYPARINDIWGTVEQYVLTARVGPDADRLRAAWAEAFPEQSLEITRCE